MISLRRGLATAVAAAYLTSAATFGLLTPAPAHAVVKNVQIVDAGGEPVAGQTITIVFPAGVTNEAGESQVEEESDDRGFIYFDFPADGAYTLRFNGGEMVYEVTGASASRGISTTEVVIGAIAAVGVGALALSGDDDDSDTAVVGTPQTPVAEEEEAADDEEEAVEEEDPMTEEPTEEEPAEEDPMTEPPAEEPMEEDPMTEPPAEEPMEEETMEEEPMTEPPAEEPMEEDPMMPSMPEPEPEPEPEAPDPVLDGAFEGSIGSATEERNPDGHPISSLINALIVLEFVVSDLTSSFNVDVHVSNPGAGGLDFRFQTMGTAQVSNGTVTVTTQPATAMGVFETFQTEGQLWELTITGDANANNTVMQVTGTGVIAVGTDGALPDSNGDGTGQPLEASIDFTAMMP